jgi:hypothetical protein
MNEWVTVRNTEGAIYTTGRKVCSDLRRKFRHSVGTSDTHWETLFSRQPRSAQEVSVGTSDMRRNFRRVNTADAGRNCWHSRGTGPASGLPTRARAELNVGTSDSRRDFRRSQFSRSTSGVPTHVGTSDTRSHKG